MESDPKVESNSPERAAYRELFEDLDAQVDAAGNRSLAKVLEKHAFPIYEAAVRRHRMLKERLPENIKRNPRKAVEELAVKAGGAAAEVLVGGIDLVWDVVTAPIHLTLNPEIRHPLYKATLARFASEAGRNAKPREVHQDFGDQEKMPYTTHMTTPPRPEAEPHSSAAIPGMPADVVPPVSPDEIPPDVPEVPGMITPSTVTGSPDNQHGSTETNAGQEAGKAEPVMPPTTPERREHSPQREAFHRLMRDIFEVTEPALREDVRDRIETNGALTLTAAQAWHEATKTPWNLPKHIRNFDIALRGRDLGSLKMRFAREAVNSLIGMGAVSIDVLDTPVEAANLTPTTGLMAAGWEFLTDSAINYGTNFVVRAATDKQHVHYASPLSRTISTGVNLFPGIRQFVDAPMLESFIRRGYNIPIAGIPIEFLYRHGNEMLIAAQRDPRMSWVQDFMIRIIGGYSAGRTAQRQRAARGA